MADGRHLPVEYSGDLGDIGGVEQDVVELVVVVNQRRSTVRRKVFRQPLGDAVYLGDLIRLRTCVTLDPTRDLAFDITIGLAEIGQTDGGVVDRVQICQVVDERLAQLSRTSGEISSPSGGSRGRMMPGMRCIT